MNRLHHHYLAEEFPVSHGWSWMVMGVAFHQPDVCQTVTMSWPWPVACNVSSGDQQLSLGPWIETGPLDKGNYTLVN